MGSHHENVKLTAAELSYLWTSYLSDGMSVCILKYFLQHINDNAIKTVIEHGLDLSYQHMAHIQGIFEKEGIKVPNGFTDEDVNLKAKRLFSPYLLSEIYS